MRVLLGCLGVVVAAAFAVGIAPDKARADANCSDFSTQAQAQTFFLNHGGPSSDPNGLDADHDGVACEALPCPCSTSSGGGGGGGHPGHKPGHKPHHKKKKKHRKPLERHRRPGAVFFPSKCTHKDFQPVGIIITCADVALRIEGLSWSSWDRLTATGQGSLTYPNCGPGVAIAFCNTRDSSATTVTLYRPRFCANAKFNAFTRLHSVAPTATGTWGDGNALADFISPFPCKLYGK